MSRPRGTRSKFYACIIVTSCNYHAFVAETVDSVLAQTRPPLDVIVVDNGSTDGSPDLYRLSSYSWAVSEALSAYGC